MSSHKLPQLWQRLLDQMSRSICSSSIDPKQMSPGLFLQMTELPEPSAATWKKLTQDMQVSGGTVPYHTSLNLKKCGRCPVAGQQIQGPVSVCFKVVSGSPGCSWFCLSITLWSSVPQLDNLATGYGVCGRRQSLSYGICVH
jgi:hypothetical protein